MAMGRVTSTQHIRLIPADALLGNYSLTHSLEATNEMCLGGRWLQQLLHAQWMLDNVWNQSGC